MKRKNEAEDSGKKQKKVKYTWSYDERLLDLKGVKREMPLEQFFNILSREKNLKLFFKESEERSNKRRKGSQSLEKVICDTYGPKYTSCSISDFQMLIDITCSSLVNKENYRNVLRALNPLFIHGMYSTSQWSKEQNARNVFLTSFEEYHPFIDPVVRRLVQRDGTFQMSDESQALMKDSKDTVKEENLRTRIKISELVVRDLAKKLVSIILDQDEYGTFEWISSVQLYAGLSFGLRWIESIMITDLKVSDDPKWDKDFYIIQKGYAKAGKHVRKKLYNAAYQETNGDLEKMYDVETSTEQFDDMLEVDLSESRVKPVLFTELGISPTRLVEYIYQMRKMVTKGMEKRGFKGTNTLVYRSKVRNVYLGPAIAKLRELLGDSVQRSVLKSNRTHVLRKIYASLSYKTFGPPEVNPNSWYKEVLFHHNLTVSFSYDTIYIDTALAVGEGESLKSIVDRLVVDNRQMRELLGKQQLVIETLSSKLEESVRKMLEIDDLRKFDETKRSIVIDGIKLEKVHEKNLRPKGEEQKEEYINSLAADVLQSLRAQGFTHRLLKKAELVALGMSVRKAAKIIQLWKRDIV